MGNIFVCDHNCKTSHCSRTEEPVLHLTYCILSTNQFCSNIGFSLVHDSLIPGYFLYSSTKVHRNLQNWVMKISVCPKKKEEQVSAAPWARYCYNRDQALRWPIQIAVAKIYNDTLRYLFRWWSRCAHEISGEGS